MSTPLSPEVAQQVHRIDRFRVPAAARKEFLARVRETHAFLQGIPECLHNWILEQPDGNGGSTIVTAVVWTTPEAFAAAKEAASAWRTARGFNPRELLPRLGVEAEFGEFRRIAV